MNEHEMVSLERKQARLLREQKKARAKSEWEMARSRLRLEMTRHLGKNHAIGADELFEIVFLRRHEGNKMTGCRLLRKLVAEEKYGPAKLFIASSCCTIRPGYYLPITDSERRAYVARRKNKLKRDIGRLASLDAVNAGAYAGQLALEIVEGSGQ